MIDILTPLIQGYGLRRGSSLDRELLLSYMQRTYQDLFPNGSFGHLAQTVDRYFSDDTPIWWVNVLDHHPAMAEPQPHALASNHSDRAPVGCLWLGHAVNQVDGDRQTYIFLLYVAPHHRRQGIGSALMQYAEDWSIAHGNRQIGLQVFQANPAIQLYRQLGYTVESLWMVKPL